MSHEFSSELQAIVAADPEAIWQAIATGPGIDSWLMGRNEIDPPNADGAGGVLRTVMGEYTPVSDITAWNPPHHLAHTSRPEPDGRYLGYEFLVEGRDASTSVVRLVVNGFLPQDDWEDEFEAMSKGGDLFFATLGEYAAHFAGRHGEAVITVSPPVENWDDAWRAVREALGLGAAPAIGDVALVRLGDQEPVAGVVYFANAETLGIRTETGLLRFVKGFQGPMMTMHAAFEPVTPETFEAWTAWLADTLAPVMAVPEGAM